VCVEVKTERGTKMQSERDRLQSRAGQTCLIDKLPVRERLPSHDSNRDLPGRREEAAPVQSRRLRVVHCPARGGQRSWHVRQTGGITS